MANNIATKNLQYANISSRITNYLQKKDNPNEGSSVNLKLMVNHENTGFFIKMSKNLFTSEELKLEVISDLESILNREVILGTRHLYVGTKFM